MQEEENDCDIAESVFFIMILNENYYEAIEIVCQIRFILKALADALAR